MPVDSTPSASESTFVPPVNAYFYNNHAKFIEKSITHRRFKQRDVAAVLDKFRANRTFQIKKIGESLYERDIFLVKAGSGPTKILMWSQMHGDEPTATMAIMDMMHFLGQPAGVDSIRDEILQKATLYFIPMLNPDGAEIYERRTAIGVDMNRDAISLQSPESKILKSVRDSLQPQFGFNLHDQNTRYSAGRSPKPATISFLAPAYDHEKNINDVRGNAMKMIGILNRVLQQYIPGQVAKYADAHEPRAFGDNIQKWGTSVVLIESGGYPGDPEKQYIRKLNYTALLTACHTIANQSYANENFAEYDAIPENARFLFDLLIHNARVQRNGQWVSMDIGINQMEVNARQSTTFYYRSIVEDIGDMSVNYGFEELDAEGMELVPGKLYSTTIRSISALRQMDIPKLLRQGYTTVRVTRLDTPDRFLDVPINATTSSRAPSGDVGLSRNPNFLLRQNGQYRYAIINGFVYDLRENKNGVKNGLIF